ncbi:multidrug/biocide efflux PACE transporter [Variovorax sp. HJSM1_2]|uniref:multidrug/biocide efflux PACE transporter n=1 Tax=Variovorax sp. HJSM1_2 TaxID=3366263 RepID=UPI003BC46DFE
MSASNLNSSAVNPATANALKKSLAERFFQALLFELIAVVLCAVVGAWLLGYSLVHMGALTIMISLCAMFWNMVFNALFDRAQTRFGFKRGVTARVIHAVMFELGLIAAVVPLAAWWLAIGLWEAFVLDIGIALFFLPYTFAYNWAYDTLRARFMRRRAGQPAPSAMADAAATSTARPQTR